jgi:hypothetical protein
MESECPLPHSQFPATCLYPEPAQSSPYPQIPLPQRFILILSSHLHLGLPSGLVPSGFPIKTLYKPLLSPTHATCPAHLILDFNTRTILGAENISQRSSLWCFLHSPVTSSLLRTNVLNTLFSNTLNLVPPSMSETKFHTHIKHAKL